MQASQVVCNKIKVLWNALTSAVEANDTQPGKNIK